MPDTRLPEARATLIIRGHKLRMYLPHKRTFTANIIIGVSIALFVYYLKESSLLEFLLRHARRPVIRHAVTRMVRTARMRLGTALVAAGTAVRGRTAA